MNNTILNCFSSSYSEAREKLFRAAKAASLPVNSHVHPCLKGPMDAELSIDVIEIIPSGATKLLVVTSGLHGVEGYAGSAVQINALNRKVFSSLPEDTGVVLVHCLNPWGMAYYMRTDENNVDNNRNFLTSFEPADLPVQHALTESAHEAYVAIPHNPELQEQFEREHVKELQAALSQGQYTNPEGIFYGGSEPSWTNTTWHKIIGQYTNTNYRGIIHIDIHTGLGPNGYGELISDSDREQAAFKRAQTIWGEDAVKSSVDGSAASAFTTGTIDFSWPQYVTSICFEFGTIPDVRVVLDALIKANHSYLDGFTNAALRAEAVARMKAAFCPDDPIWLAAVINQCDLVFQKAILGFDKIIYQAK
jgi:hypothetical protein